MSRRSCSCRGCLAETLRRAQRQYHAGRPKVGGLMLWRVVEALEAPRPQPVCSRDIDCVARQLDAMGEREAQT